ncbi:PREDICTED: transmembrane protein FLJ37396 [Condylura cristata]|uniref:transmembrane protein FLJ37396 n=1 Tax=Condylura cristata TaxID=143302 RepID=UPI0003342CE6|nr:PREDICTED: transmembrane protein FLJ37396 [Condylura cristata]
MNFVLFLFKDTEKQSLQTMDEIYKVASTERVRQLEKELAVQLAELKSEIEEQGILQGTASRAYSWQGGVLHVFQNDLAVFAKFHLEKVASVPGWLSVDVPKIQGSVQIPKDMSYFRRERELALKKTLQVAEPKALVVQADAMQRELESCLRREYTPENLPLLLLQKQVAYIMQEYNDALQRAERLSVARENLLMGKSNPPNLVTQEDLTIYTKWLVCHLHSLRTVHHYLQALQYLPISKVLSVTVDEVPEVDEKNEKARVVDTDSDIQGSVSPGPTDTSILGLMGTEAPFVLPQHTTETEDLKPQLRRLLSHFNIPYDVEELVGAAKEMELFSLVSQKFRSIFMEQQRMLTFPDYEAGVAKAASWDSAASGMALKKRANWTSFIKISKPERVMQVLQDHAAKTVTLAPSHPTFMASQDLHQCNYDQIWEDIYNNTKLYQNENMKEDDLSMERNENDLAQISLSQCADGLVKQKKEKRFNYAMSLQLLGLHDGTGLRDGDSVLMRGAYLSFLYLRHLRIRELQRICLGLLNYFRSVERTLTINTAGLTLVAGNLISTVEESSCENLAKGGVGTLQGLGAHLYVHGTPAEQKVHNAQFMEFSEVENQDDYYSSGSGCIHTQDQRGLPVMYDEALRDLEELGAELLLVASHYIEKEKGHKEGSVSNTGLIWGWAHAGVDRFAVLYDLWTWEAALLENKRQLLDSYFEAYQHVLDPEERFALAQVITDIMHRRPRFELSHPYFTKAYRDECTCLRLHGQLVQGILNQQIENQREYVQRLWQEDRADDSNTFGIPLNIICKQLISLNNSCPALKNIYLLEFHPSLGLASLIPRALEHLLREARCACRPTSASALALLERSVLKLALDVWLTPATPEASYSAQLQKDLFSAKVMSDPFLVREIGLRALKSAADNGQTQGQDSHALLLETFSKLLELLTLRHRLIEMSLESVYLARLYKELAWEMGFEEFHLYLRSVPFEFASYKDKMDCSPPVFITSLLEDSDRVDRYSPTTLLLAISELDDNQLGKFSFYKKEAVLKLLFHSGVENMQVALACQAVQKNALMVAVQQATFYHTPQGGPVVVKVSLWQRRAPEAFVSLQLEKVGLRDMMLNAFLLKKQSMADRMNSLVSVDEIGKVKREVIIEYCQKFNHHMSHYALRGQIMAYCNSLRALLEDFPSIRDTYFMMGQRQGKQGLRDSKEDPKLDPSGPGKQVQLKLGDSVCKGPVWQHIHTEQLLSRGWGESAQ